jgi:hypothetical protein
VLDEQRGALIHRLIGHEGEVHALDWAPPTAHPTPTPRAISGTNDPPNSWEDEVPVGGLIGGGGGGAGLGEAGGGESAAVAGPGLLVSSSGRDRTIRVWRTKDATCRDVLKLPRPQAGKGEQVDISISNYV